MKKKRPQGGDDDRDLFERAMEGVKPLAGRPQGPPPKKRPPRGRPRPDLEPAAPFTVERWGERIEGLARGGDRRQLRRLRRGELPVELKLDLHGLDQEQARGAVRSSLTRALGAGMRCLLVVHGRGRGSPAGPVLKESLPGWLAEAPHGRRVLAFTSAPPRLGGPGATLVLLRRSKAG